MTKIGTIEVCPGQTEACKGFFLRRSAFQKRCNQCSKIIRKEQKRLTSRRLYLSKGGPSKGENMSRIGIVEVCPGSSEACEGTFIRKSGFQIRCKPCAKQARREAAKEYQRQRRGYYEEEEEKEIRYGKIKKYFEHPCWCCQKPTTNRALCNSCYENDGKYNGMDLCKKQICEKEKEIRKELCKEVVIYSCKNMTQEELKKLVPSLNADTEARMSG